MFPSPYEKYLLKWIAHHQECARASHSLARRHVDRALDADWARSIPIAYWLLEASLRQMEGATHSMTASNLRDQYDNLPRRRPHQEN